MGSLGEALFFYHCESDVCANPDTECLSGIAITYGDACVTRTVAIHKWSSIVGAIGKEAPALLYHDTIF